MNKKITSILAVLLACTVVLSGCTGGSGSKSSSSTSSAADSSVSPSSASSSGGASSKQTSSDSSKGSSASSQTGTGTAKDTKTEAVIYVSNEDGSAFEKKTVTLDALTPQNLIDALITYKAVPEGTTAVSMKKEQADDGSTRLTLDLSDSFQKGLNNCGSSGEYLMLGCIVNTFLDAYSASGVRITVEGDTLESPNAGEMAGYLRKYK